MRSANPGAVVAACLAGLLAVASAVGSEDAPAAPADPWSAAAVRERFPDPDKDAKSEDYTGSLDCKDCHEDRWKSLGESAHAAVRAEKTDGSRGCESCHGPGFEHFREAGEAPIRHPRKAAAAAVDGACLVCHVKVLTEPVAGHREWVEGGAGEPARCTLCHRVHVPKGDPAIDRTLGPIATAAELGRHAEHVPARTCIGCHPGFHPEMRRSGHAFLLAKGDGCGTCHGPGSLHAASGGRVEKILHPGRQKAAAVNAACNTCHAKGEAVQRWTCSEHAREGVSCIVCHDTNARKGKTLRAPEYELCGSCHQDVKAQFRLPNRHRVKEGRVACSDCHDPHGNKSKVRDKDLRLRTCFECHREKRGPFLFDHGIKRSDGCVACHEPHGSPNRRLLSHTRMRDMCLQCHPETGHDLTRRRYANCISCHVEIHGSDLDRLYRR